MSLPPGVGEFQISSRDFCVGQSELDSVRMGRELESDGGIGSRIVSSAFRDVLPGETEQSGWIDFKNGSVDSPRHRERGFVGLHDFIGRASFSEFAESEPGF